MRKPDKNKIPVYIIAILAGIIVYFISSQYKLGFSPDSVSYFEVANSLQKGNGFTNLNGEFVNHWPPGYPVFIFFIAKVFCVSSMIAGVIGNALLIFFTVLILYEIFKSFQIPDRFIYLLLILYLSSPISYIYLWYLSEALFIPFILLSFLFLREWLLTEKRINLILTGLFLGLSVLIRFAGLGFMGAYLIFLIIQLRKKFVRSIFLNALTLLISFLLVVLPWMIYANLQGSGSIDRRFDFELIPFFKIRELFLSFGSWIFGSLEGLLFMGAFSVFLMIIYHKSIRSSLKYIAINEAIKNEKIKLLISLSIIYILFLLFSVSVLDHAIPLTNRIFSPLYPFFLCVLGIFLGFIYRHTSKILAFLIPLVMLISYSFTSMPVYYNHYKNGSGFTSVKFTRSPTISYAEDRLKGKLIYTNDLFLLKIFSGFREIKLLPPVKSSASFRDIPLEVIKGKAAIIYLDRVDWRNYIMSRESLLNSFEDNYILKFQDGIIITKD